MKTNMLRALSRPSFVGWTGIGQISCWWTIISRLLTRKDIWTYNYEVNAPWLLDQARVWDMLLHSVWHLREPKWQLMVAIPTASMKQPEKYVSRRMLISYQYRGMLDNLI